MDKNACLPLKQLKLLICDAEIKGELEIML